MLGKIELRKASIAVLAVAMIAGFTPQRAEARNGAGIAAGVVAGVILGAAVAGAASSRARAAPAPRQRTTVQRSSTVRSSAKKSKGSSSGSAASNNEMVPSERNKAIPASGSAGSDPFANSQQVRQ